MEYLGRSIELTVRALLVVILVVCTFGAVFLVMDVDKFMGVE